MTKVTEAIKMITANIDKHESYFEINNIYLGSLDVIIENEYYNDSEKILILKGIKEHYEKRITEILK